LSPALLERLGNNAPELRAALQGWDFRYTLDSPAPTAFDTFMEVWQARVVRARFPERLHALVQSQPSVAARLIERADLDWFAGDLQSEIAAAAQDTLAQLRTRYGQNPSDWQWRNAHHAHWKHPASNAAFDIGPAEVDGGSDTVRNTGMVGALGGSEYRIVVDFAEPERLWAVQNIGNSGVPGNPHYQDQFDDWRAGRYHVVSLRRAEVERDLESQTVLEVAPAVVQ
jgi:penicillin amidase